MMSKKKMGVLLAVVLMNIFAGPGIYAGENLVVFNSSFEAGRKGWFSGDSSLNYNARRPDFWTTMSKVIIDDTTSVQGKKSLKVTVPPDGSCCVISYPFLTLKPNTQYTLSYYVKSEKGGQVSMRFDGIEHWAGIPGHSLTPEWKRYSGVITIPNLKGSNQTLHMYVRNTCANGSQTQVWIDGIQLEEGPLTDYHMGAPCEVESILNNSRHNRYYLGEKPSADVTVYSQASNELVEVAFRVEDYKKRTVKEGKTGVEIRDHYCKTILDLSVPGKGYFHVYLTLLKNGGPQADWEEQFAMIEPHRNLDFDDDSFWGSHIGSLGAGTNNPKSGLSVGNDISPAEWAALAEDMGIKWQRDFAVGAWCGMELNENDFVFCDEWVKLLTEHKIRIMPILGHQLRSTIPEWVAREKWIQNDTAPRSESLHMDAKGLLPKQELWDKYVATIVGHYKDRIKTWELMNEPNWEMTPEEYYLLLKRTYDAAKKTDPDCRLVGPGSTSDGGSKDVTSYIYQLLKLGGGQYLDAISFHFYGNVTSLTSRCRVMKDMIEADKFASGKPGWSSELSFVCTSDYYRSKMKQPFVETQWGGYGGCVNDDGMLMTELTAACCRIQSHVIHLGEGVKRYFDHTLPAAFTTNKGGDGARDGTPVIMMPAYCNMVWMLDKVNPVCRLELSPKITCYVFRGKESDSYVAVLWTSDDETGWFTPKNKTSWFARICKSNGINIYDMMGNSLGEEAVEISPCPVYIKGQKISKDDFLAYLKGLNIWGLTTEQLSFGDKIRCNLSSGKEKGSCRAVVRVVDDRYLCQPNKEKPGVMIIPEHDSRIRLTDINGREVTQNKTEISRRSPVYIHAAQMSRGDFVSFVQKLQFPDHLLVVCRATLADENGQAGIKAAYSNQFGEALSGKINCWSSFPKGLVLSNPSDRDMALTLSPREGGEFFTPFFTPIRLQGKINGKIGMSFEAGGKKWTCDKPVNVLPCHRTAKAWSLEEKMDTNEWEQARTIVINDKSQISAGDKALWGGVDDLSARALVGWDDRTLYVDIEVKDKDLVVSADDNRLYEGGSVELYFDTDPGKDMNNTSYTDGCLQLVISPRDDKHGLRICVAQSGRGSKIDKGQLEAASQKTADGYAVRMKIPVKELGLSKLKPGLIMGFSIGIDNGRMVNGKVERKNQMTWNGKEACADRSRMEYLFFE